MNIVTGSDSLITVLSAACGEVVSSSQQHVDRVAHSSTFCQRGMGFTAH